MISAVQKWFAKKSQRWVKNRTQVATSQHLASKRIYIMPSAFGWLYGFVILTIVTGAINYQLNTAYFFVFLLVIIALLSMWQTHQNLKDVTIQCLPVDDVEQGKPAKITLFINPQNQIRYGIIFSYKKGTAVTKEKVSERGGKVEIAVETTHRGHFSVPPIKVYSYYPLGIFRVWTYLYFDRKYYVYPVASSPGFWPEALNQPSQMENTTQKPGEDELNELQSVDTPWIQASRIAWKISARGQGWYLKKLASPAGDYWLFRIEDLNTKNVEKSLQQLSYWIQTANHQKQAYALELKDFSTQYGYGAEHMKHCLRQLAVY